MPNPAHVVTNPHDASRTARACIALVGALADDPRVRAAYEAWQHAHGLPPILSRLACDHHDVDAASQFRDAVLTGHDSDLTAMGNLVAAMGLAFDWLPQLLLAQFRTWALSEATGEPLRLDVTVPAEQLNDPDWNEKGRAPKKGHTHTEDLARNVAWYYRAEIKDPPDTVYGIAREYAAAANRHTPAHSVVDNGIARVKDLLAKIDLPGGLAI